MAGQNFMNQNVKPISLGNTAFNTQSSSRATNVANQRINTNVMKSGNIGRQQAQLATKGIQNKANQQAQDRDRMIQERQEDVQTAMKYAQEDMSDFRAKIVQQIRMAQENFATQKRDDELAMREYARDFGSQKGSEAFQQGIQGAGQIGMGLISSIPSKVEPGNGLSSLLENQRNPLNKTNFGDSFNDTLSKFGAGGPNANLDALNVNPNFLPIGNTVQNALNTSNLNPPIGDIFSGEYGTDDINLIFGEDF